ncbi:retrovirus-related pol polyprotein from transposon TNT 1-94 [Tanacetum coccineum]
MFNYQRKFTLLEKAGHHGIMGIEMRCSNKDCTVETPANAMDVQDGIDYQEIDGGFVAFGGSPKGGKITRKGKIRTGKLDFEDVYFVKELKCDNGIEFKNNDMNQFCRMKGIKREFSVARTPQQNRVAKRKNRTLIEAARTMLADSLLPTTFWAKAVSTACYVQNRDPQENFDKKADEGFFIGYSINSKFTAGNPNIRMQVTEDNVDAVPTQQYILLPLLYNSPQSSEDAVADDAGNKTNEEPTNEGERNGQEKERGASNKEDD